MSTNPNNAVGTNGAYGGRTSVKALNDILASLSGRGVVSGWTVSPGTGMTLSVGGVAGTRDVAVAEDNNGNRTTVNNISEAPISVTLPAAPSSNSRVDGIIAYVNNPPEGTANTVDNPAACGLIVVSSPVSANPTFPDDTAIRAAITADGASGSTAYYFIVATARIAAGTTNVTADMIGAGDKAVPSIGDGTVTADKIDWAALYTAREAIPIPSRANLNSNSYFNTGRFYVQSNSVVSSLSNCPTTFAFLMEVINLLGESTSGEGTTDWQYFVRRITDYTGNIYIQSVVSKPTGVEWGAWKKVTVA